MEQLVLGLVDSGSEHTLVAPWIAQAIGIDPKDALRSVVLGIGGDSIEVRFIDVSLRLHARADAIDDYVEWECEVGIVDTWRAPWAVLLGQVGFFNRFTISMHRHAQIVVVEDFDAFDARFGANL